MRVGVEATPEMIKHYSFRERAGLGERQGSGAERKSTHDGDFSSSSYVVARGVGPLISLGGLVSQDSRNDQVGAVNGTTDTTGGMQSDGGSST